MRAIDCSSCVHFIPVSVHKSFQSSSSAASSVDVDVDVDKDINVDVDVDVDVDVEDTKASKLPVSSPDWTFSIRTGTFGRPPSLWMDKPLPQSFT